MSLTTKRTLINNSSKFWASLKFATLFGVVLMTCGFLSNNNFLSSIDNNKNLSNSEDSFCPIITSSTCINTQENTAFLYEQGDINTVKVEEPNIEILKKEIKINNIIELASNGTIFNIDQIKKNMGGDIDSIENLYINEDISDEYIQKIYEEELPSDIKDTNINLPEEDFLEDGYFTYQQHKPISDININISKKPAYFGKIPVIAIVIDDMGISKKRTKDIISIKAPITSSFLTYSTNLNSQINEAKMAGHEIIAHIPMEAKKNKDVAPDVLTTQMSQEQISKTFTNMLDKFDDIKGINNHMGSKLTEDSQAMETILSILKSKNMFFLDSKTSAKSVGKKVSDKLEVSYIGRNIFIDNENNYDYITNQLDKAKIVAYKRGYAVAIGHPKSQTFLALKDWIKNNDNSSIKVVHLSSIVDKLYPEHEKN